MHVAWLRGINVGGKNRLPMKDLVAFFETAGAREVSTYIQSGNVAFRAPKPADVRVSVVQQIQERFGYEVPIVLRSAKALGAAVDGNPLFDAQVEPKTLHVAFLDRAPTAAKIATLDSNRSPPDVFVVDGKHIFLRFPNGMARTKLTNDYFERKLGVQSTVRNWNTVTKMMEMAKGRSR